MFSVYDTSGRSFRDTLERLYKVRKLSPATPYSKDEEEAPQGVRQRGTASQQAIDAYRKAIHLSTREPVYHAHQIMTTPVVSIDRQAGLSQAQDRFERMKIHQMPVLSERQIITGIITRHGLEKALLKASGGHSSPRSIADVMSREVICADPITDIRRVVKLLLDFHMNAMPIVNEQDLLIGIVSRKDILRAVINDPPLRLFT